MDFELGFSNATSVTQIGVHNNLQPSPAPCLDDVVVVAPGGVGHQHRVHRAVEAPQYIKPDAQRPGARQALQGRQATLDNHTAVANIDDGGSNVGQTAGTEGEVRGGLTWEAPTKPTSAMAGESGP